MSEGPPASPATPVSAPGGALDARAPRLDLAGACYTVVNLDLCAVGGYTTIKPLLNPPTMLHPPTGGETVSRQALEL